MRGATSVILQLHQILPLPRKMILMIALLFSTLLYSSLLFSILYSTLLFSTILYFYSALLC